MAHLVKSYQCFHLHDFTNVDAFMLLMIKGLVRQNKELIEPISFNQMTHPNQ